MGVKADGGEWVEGGGWWWLAGWWGGEGGNGERGGGWRADEGVWRVVTGRVVVRRR